MKLTDTRAINQKIDPYYYSLKDTTKDDEEVSFFINSTHPLTNDEIENLKKEGCTRVSLVVNNISTASAPIGLIPQIAALDFISLIEMSRKLYPN
ncbi:MAG: hypothetical protein A3F80_01710 [Candidatus Melainabacteria bacterium RIFCSPLOWO2_12_FULL_35_11]|nr:MAG: hypothetical protein A3F80_01710 [Candidatus Melainabacteria bacterium RIFCSPLOWO2_12_FULL_35_11]